MANVVLIVDDDQSVLNTMHALLEHLTKDRGVVLIKANMVTAAVEAALKLREPYVLLSDYSLDNRQTADVLVGNLRANRRSPERVALVSGQFPRDLNWLKLACGGTEYVECWDKPIGLMKVKEIATWLLPEA